MPTYKISVDQSNRPDGDEIEVFPFGIVPNRGGSIEVEMEREQADYMATGHGVVVKTEAGKEVKAKKFDETMEIAVVGEPEGGEEK